MSYKQPIYLTKDYLKNKSDNPINKSLAQLELKHIQLEIQNRLANPKHLRHFIDQWFCYKNGYVYNNKLNNPAWNFINFREYVSPGALSFIQGNTNGAQKLIKEHIVPVDVFSKMIFPQIKGKVTLSVIEKHLSEYLNFAIITDIEDKQLLKNGMPKGWACGGDPFARYREKIQLGKISNWNCPIRDWTWIQHIYI